MSALVSVRGLGIRSVADPRVTVSFTMAVTKPTATLGFRGDIVPPAKRWTVAEIQKVVADHYHLSVSELLSDRRARHVARPRQVAMWLCKRLTKRSLPDIGRRTGGRDHTTVLYAVRVIDRLRAEQPALARDVDALLFKLGGAPE